MVSLVLRGLRASTTQKTHGPLLSSTAAVKPPSSTLANAAGNTLGSLCL